MTLMKRYYCILCVLLFSVSISSCQEKSNGYLVKVGDIAPDFKITEAGGKTYRLSELRGKVVMLQFTASWCSVCRKEMPFIEKEIWQEKESSGLVVLGIDRDEPVDKVLKFRKDIGITYPLALDPGADIFGLYALKEAGFRVRIMTRDLQKARKVFDNSFGIFAGDPTDVSCVEEALNGCYGVHISLPNESEQQAAEIVAKVADSPSTVTAMLVQSARELSQLCSESGTPAAAKRASRRTRLMAGSAGSGVPKVLGSRAMPG